MIFLVSISSQDVNILEFSKLNLKSIKNDEKNMLVQ
jgi:hypothetical protein